MTQFRVAANLRKVRHPSPWFVNLGVQYPYLKTLLQK
jgi:hypothetical protein